ncbi:MAG: carboxylesterase family protein [Flavitalea sp.]
MKTRLLVTLWSIMAGSTAFAQLNNHPAAPRIKTLNGELEGTCLSGISIFKGVPFAKPPIGKLRWKEPQPVDNWKGIRKADKFGPMAMQLPVYDDMIFRSDGMSEDCLYLNVWTPAKSPAERLPVLVYFFGGGFIAGDGSESRYEGENMARQGIVAITVNFRLTVFGLLAHPELTKESPHHASGNYTLLDQAAALKWVKQNIAAFGGDPAKITIAGESAGSYSVSAQVTSPLSRKLIAGAIGESGALLGMHAPSPLAEAEKTGLEFAEELGASSLAELRAMPAEKILEATGKTDDSRFPVTVDGYFFPKMPGEIFAAGEQANVPLLVGWNSEENNYQAILGNEEPTVENYTKALKRQYGDHAAEVLKYYPAASNDLVKSAATKLASDEFMGYCTWKWSDIQIRTGTKPVYRYLFCRPRPLMKTEVNSMLIGEANGSLKKGTLDAAVKSALDHGAPHSGEIEYVMGNLPGNQVFDWRPDDYKVSLVFQAYFVNFIKTGNPNGLGLPVWPALKTGQPADVMHVDADTRSEQEKDSERAQYLFFDSRYTAH